MAKSVGTSFWHLELRLPVDGWIAAEEGDCRLVGVGWPGGDLIKKFADGEVDVFGEVGNMRVHCDRIILNRSAAII